MLQNPRCNLLGRWAHNGGNFCGWIFSWLNTIFVLKCPNPLYEEHIAKNLPGKKPLKNMEYKLHSLWGQDVPSKLTPPITTPSGWPATSSPALKDLVGKPGAAQKLLEEKYGVMDLRCAVDILEDEDESVGQSPDLSVSGL